MKLKLIVNTFFILTLGHNALAEMGLMGNSLTSAATCSVLDLSSLDKLDKEVISIEQNATLSAFKQKQLSSHCVLSQENINTWNRLTSIEEKISFLSLLMVQSPGPN